MTYEEMLAGTVYFAGYNGDTVGGYMARPLGSGQYLGVIEEQYIVFLLSHR